MLVGRDREIDAIGAAIERAQRGERAAVMLTGEPGIGKSTLLDELARRVMAAGGVAVWGRSAEVGVTPPFWPWTQVLAALEIDDEQQATRAASRHPVARTGQAGATDNGRDAAPRAGDAFAVRPRPSAANLLAELADQPAAATRLARFEEVVQVVQRSGRRQLTALLFDDAHGADLGSLQLLEYLLPRLSGDVVVAVAARDADASPSIAASLGRIQRAARRMPLRRLDRGEIAGLVEDRGADAGVAARVFELTEGNPLFAVELLESIADGGALQLPAVSSVRAIVHDRVERMPDGTGELLVAAAIVGREFRVAVIADMLGISDDEATRRLDPVRKLGMVAAVTADRNRFSHALIAEALADELEPSERARLHLRAAQAIEKRDGGPAGQGNEAAVAHHLLEAGHLAAEAAVIAAERAAAAAMARLGFEDAAALLERAVAALALAAPGDLARRAGLECRWAEALQHAGDHARGSERCEAAARLARELGDDQLLARIAIVRGIEMRFGRIDPLLVAALREGLTALGDRGDGDRPTLRAKLLARLAAAEQPAPDPAGPVARAREAIGLGRALPDRDRLAVLYIATAALVDYVPPAELEPIHHETLALATALDDRPVIAHTLTRLCFTAMERFDRVEHARLHAELRARATALGLPRWIRTVHLLDAMVALLEGRFADAEHAADAAEAVPDPDGRFLVDFHRLMAINVKTTRPGPELREVARSYTPGRPMLDCWLAGIDGDVDAMRAALALLERLPTDLELALLLAPLLAELGPTDQAAELYRRGQARRGRAIVASMLGTCVLDLPDRLLMFLAASLDRWDDVEELAASALAIAERLGSPVWTTRVRSDLADLLARYRPADPRIAELRAAALVEAERIGMPGVVERCRGAKRPVPVTANLAIERAGELWSVHGFGEHTHLKDSRGIQILAQLLASPRREIHVLELTGSGAVDGGDAGEVLDATARAQYRERLRELVGERDEAEAWGDTGRLERASAEIEALTGELERAVGLGGRERRVGSASERARSNVQRRVNHALQQIRAACPRLGEHLAATIHTGTYCRYEP
jgi:hypothetical protein